LVAPRRFADRLMTQRVERVSPQESDDILEQLYEIGERPEFVDEPVWKLGQSLHDFRREVRATDCAEVE
jgi:hypothetical protein